MQLMLADKCGLLAQVDWENPVGGGVSVSVIESLRFFL